MLLIPAIDLKEGRCVRLRQGRMQDDTVFSDDPVAVAGRWIQEGARRLHLVDLDGAFAGEPRNAAVVHAIRARYPALPMQIGGGIRTLETAAAYIEAGISFVIVGTQAVRTPSFVGDLCRHFPGQLMVGLDARDGRVAVEGWSESTDVDAIELAKRFEGEGASAIVYTDIERDGMLQGVNVLATEHLARAISTPVIASGGVTDLGDIEHLCEVADAGIDGVIIGRALYQGSIDLADARQLVGDMLGEGLA